MMSSALSALAALECLSSRAFDQLARRASEHVGVHRSQFHEYFTTVLSSNSRHRRCGSQAPQGDKLSERSRIWSEYSAQEEGDECGHRSVVNVLQGCQVPGRRRVILGTAAMTCRSLANGASTLASWSSCGCSLTITRRPRPGYPSELMISCEVSRWTLLGHLAAGSDLAGGQYRCNPRHVMAGATCTLTARIRRRWFRHSADAGEDSSRLGKSYRSPVSAVASRSSTPPPGYRRRLGWRCRPRGPCSSGPDQQPTSTGRTDKLRTWTYGPLGTPGFRGGLLARGNLRGGWLGGIGLASAAALLTLLRRVRSLGIASPVSKLYPDDFLETERLFHSSEAHFPTLCGA